MKKIWMMMAMVAIFTACSNEEEFDSQVGNYTLTGYANVESRTAFGTPGDSSIPFAWSADDYIYAGSAKSYAIANGGISATFIFPSNPSGDVYYNIVGSSATEAHVKAEQTAGDLGANGDFGYGTISNGSFTLNHATAYLWFNITALPEGATLQSITFDAGAATIAGKATWDGSKFGSISDGSNSIQLNVNKATVSGAETSMVVYPAVVESASVTYQFSVGGTTKYYKQLLGAKTFTKGTTYKISVNLATADLYELRVLTFEDEDAKFKPYNLDYADGWSGKEITTWSDLIDDPQYGGPLTYADQMSAMYTWWDEGNTELTHTFPGNYDTYCYWGGGHAISNYWGTGYANEDRDKHIAKYYGEDYVSQWEGNDSMLGWFNLQFMSPVPAHSGENFAVHYGYKDDFAFIENLPEITFEDGEARVIDHMYVCNTNYTLNQLVCGVKSEAGNTFGGSWTGLNEDAWLKIVAQGFDDVDADAYAEPISEVEFYLVKGQNVVETWQKWDLSGLGAVAKVRFNFLYSDDMGGKYGFTIPGYFAYDDIAVRY